MNEIWVLDYRNDYLCEYEPVFFSTFDKANKRFKDCVADIEKYKTVEYSEDGNSIEWEEKDGCYACLSLYKAIVE